MIKMFMGFCIGVAVMLAFLYLGGGTWLREFGSTTERAGAHLEVYEKRLKESTQGAEKAAGKTIEKTKEKVGQYVK
ncbi:MAG: hypothetical protein HZB85_08800 [Deltaproteobacteria bacterium]|nr:hypothetical protein [Deltaproteobacteria bacterium]